MESVLVSIIIPIYNIDLAVFELCINSILIQSYANLEIILVDDGSNDKTAHYLNSVVLRDKRFRLYHKKHEGVSAARNLGIIKASGEYITFVDADDVISFDMISVSVSCAIESKADIVLWKHAKVVDNQFKYDQESVIYTTFKDKQIIELQKDIWFTKKGGECAALKSLPLSVCKLYCARLVKQNDIYFDCTVSIGEDTLFTLEVLEHTKVLVAINKTMYFHKIHEGSLSHGYDPNALVKWSKNRKAFRNYLEKGRLADELWGMYDLQVIYAVKTLLINTFACPQCDLKRKDLKKTLIADEFSNSLDRITWKDIKADMGAVMILFLYKFHLYGLMIILGKIRRKQLEKVNGNAL